MPGDDQPSDVAGPPAPDARASDAERREVADRLRAAAAEGRLTLEDFSERVEQAYAATTRIDLVPLVADLPEGRADAEGERREPGGTRWIVGIMGGGDHRGRWRVAARCVVLNLMGGADLDLRQALRHGSRTQITVFSILGGSDIVVPEGVDVELGGFALMGGNDLRVEGAAPAPGAPVIRVRAYSLLGGTDVRTARRDPGSRRHALHRLH